VFAAMRLLRNTQIKNLEFHYQTSYLSELLPGANVSDRHVGEMLREVGVDRERITRFLRNFILAGEYAAIDITHIFSLSEGIISSVLGHNGKGEYLPQVNLLYLFSVERRLPSYFRMLAGSVTSVSSLKLTMKESGASNVVLVGDKGFYSAGNVSELEAAGIRYALPLRRDSRLIDYDKLKRGDMRAFGHFMFEGRPIWYYSHSTGEAKGRRVFVFLDRALLAEEEKDFLARVSEGGADGGKEERMALFYEQAHRLGTMAVLTDLDVEGGRVYELLKSRVGIEQSFDAFKNTLHADRTYMRDDYQLEGWMLVCFVALLLYYRIYNLLSENSLLKKYSPSDVLLHLSRLHKIRIEDQWVTSEIPKKTRALIDKLKIPIPIT